MSEQQQYNVAVIGGGPSGQQAAITAARAGQSVVVIEQEQDVGGACVSNGTIPSKTLRETVAALRHFAAKTAEQFPVVISDELQVQSLMTRKEQVIVAHQKIWANNYIWPAPIASTVVPVFKTSTPLT